MKDIDPALRAFLLADAAISAAVGGNRIYSGIVPQGETEPTIVQNIISEGSDYHMQGPSALGQARVQVDCWALSQTDAVELANLVMDRLSGHSGDVSYGSSSPAETVTFKGVFHDIGRDDYDAAARMFTRRRDFIVWYYIR